MKLTVAITGINAIDNPGPGTGIARCLKESGLQVRTIGLAYDAMEPGIYMNWLIDKSYICPYPSTNSQLFLERLFYIRDQENVDIIIPTLDIELPLFMKLEPTLRTKGIKMMLPDRASFRERSKDRLVALALRIGIKTPKTFNVSDMSELESACKELSFPLIVKGIYYEATKVETIEEARKAMLDLSVRWGFPVLVQEIIEGDEYNCAGLGNGEGNEIGLVAVKKMMITKLGKVWTNISIVNERIFEVSRKMVSVLKWRGGFEMEIICDNLTNELYLIEINPRFPAWIYMASACGINLPERLIRLLTDMPCDTHSCYQAGKVMVRYTGEMIRDIRDIEKLTTMAES